MALVFLNGSSPNYLGFEFSTAVALIDQIETTLVAAGWVTDAKVSGVSLFIRGRTAIASHDCWIDFIVSGVAPNLTLTIRGWQEQTKVNGSPNSIHTMTFNVGGTNRMWLTADEDSGVMTIFNSGGACSGHHFGFLQRVDTGDPWAWMVGRIYSYGYLYAYSAKSAFNGTNWRLLSADYNLYADPTNSSGGAAPLSTFDATCRGQINQTTGHANATGSNPFYLAYNGKLNYNNKALVTADYCYHEGKGTVNSYGSGNILPLYFRGYVKYTANGLASLSAAEQVLDTVSGDRFLSVGGTQWQGQQIL